MQQTIKIVNVKHTCTSFQARVSADRVMAVWALYLIWCTENAIVYFNQIFETSAHCQLDFALFFLDTSAVFISTLHQCRVL